MMSDDLVCSLCSFLRIELDECSRECLSITTANLTSKLEDLEVQFLQLHATPSNSVDSSKEVVQWTVVGPGCHGKPLSGD
jgi:hypothetical protein